MTDHNRAHLDDTHHDGDATNYALRAASLCLSTLLALILLFVRDLYVGDSGDLARAIVPIALIGIGLGYAHGLGIRPRSQITAMVAGPWVAWPLMLSTLALLVFRAA